MIGAKEFIKCECEHLIHSTSSSPSPTPAGTNQWGRLPSKRDCEQHLIDKGMQKAEARDTGTDRTSSQSRYGEF